MNQLLAPVMSNMEVMAGVYLMWLRMPSVAASARPGQFIMIRCCEEGCDPLLRRPLSVHRRRGPDVAFLYAAIGRGSEWLSRRREGELIDVLGPLGNGFSITKKAKKLLLIAGGIGIASLIFLAEEAIEAGHKVAMLYGARGRDQVYPGSELPRGLDLALTTEDGSMGQSGLLTEVVPSWADDADQLFICGPTAMYRVLSDMKELKGRSVQASLEQVMGCGYGVCYGCTISTRNGTRRVCHDGPVFELEDIYWDSVPDPRRERI